MIILIKVILLKLRSMSVTRCYVILAYIIVITISETIVMPTNFHSNSGSGSSSSSSSYKEYENHISHCEYSALRIASKICDLFNAPIDSEDWNERIHQDGIIEHLGFAPWLINGISYSNGKTLQGKQTKSIDK